MGLNRRNGERLQVAHWPCHLASCCCHHSCPPTPRAPSLVARSPALLRAAETGGAHRPFLPWQLAHCTLPGEAKRSQAVTVTPRGQELVARTLRARASKNQDRTLAGPALWQPLTP